ncbi:MAG: SPOR domain-containing protein [Sulfurospirillaceae bacterium]|nr:SPOR domain-containing protein [Sulfurospirillaceae bacterium]MDD2827299.1 SPOR domain-containing protein [Sulfurospirillaceae bacterium]
MENRNELSDIVLEKGDSKTVKVKRILILVAFLILVFLVALASMKILNKDQNKDTSKLVLPPEPSTQEAPVPKDEQLFKQVPIIEENPKKESFEDMIKTLKEKEAQKQEENQAQDTPLPPAPTKMETPKVVELKAKVDTPAKKEAPKTKEVSTASTSANAGLYIQVGAVTTAPSKHVLEDIKSKGYEYKLYDTVINGKNITKILIGPYAKSSDAEVAMNNIRTTINKNAFLYRIK